MAGDGRSSEQVAVSTGLTRSVALFTAVPVRDHSPLGPGDGPRALRWLPLVGVLVGAVAALPLVAVRQWAPHAGLLGAVVACALLAALTRCLHLDGLADTADGLGSRAEPARALEIMRQSDIGPFGVVVLVVALLAEVAALTVLRGSVWLPLAAVTVAAATGRVAAVQAAHRGVPAARGSGFGSLVAGGVGPAVSVMWTLIVLAGGAFAAVLVSVAVWWFVVPQVIALTAAFVLRRLVIARIGGMTGDVFGALIETATVISLVGMSLR
jgi:adenosylcobinamide-GDP ribazoletransferase